jgi:hypothetical protein
VKPNSFERTCRSAQVAAEKLDKDIFRKNYVGVNDVLQVPHSQCSDIRFAEVMGFASVPLVDKPLSIVILNGAYNLPNSKTCAGLEHSYELVLCSQESYARSQGKRASGDSGIACRVSEVIFI